MLRYVYIFDFHIFFIYLLELEQVLFKIFLIYLIILYFGASKMSYCLK